MIKYKRVILMLAILTLMGCGKKEEPAPETIPMPTYSTETSATISKYDDSVTYKVTESSAIESSSKDEIVVLPDRTKFDKVTVKLLQGGQNAYLFDVIKHGLVNEDKSNIEYYKRGYKIDGTVYGFIYTKKWNTIMATGTSYPEVESVLENLLENSDFQEYKHYKVNTDEEMGESNDKEEETVESVPTDEYNGY
jgi:hypothetical protein